MAEHDEDGGPQAALERRECARHLLRRPLTCYEQFPDVFSLIRRHHGALDQWFTQRLGYRLHIDADTARLFKSGIVPNDRPLRTRTDRPLHRRELQLLALVLATMSAGPLVMSLRDLIGDIRSAAVEAGTLLGVDASDRRCLVTVLQWMVDQGLVAELHDQVDRYVDDADADAVLRVRPDRIALVANSSVLGESSAADVLARSDRRDAFRQWARCHLAEDPVLYRSDLTDAEWFELRRRVGDESRMLDEMFGLTLEARVEGFAAIDPNGTLTDVRFPTGGTVGHCALLLLERVTRSGTEKAGPGTDASPSADASGLGTEASPAHEHDAVEVSAIVAELAREHAARWSKDLVANPDLLARRAIALLESQRLVEQSADGVCVLSAAYRYLPTVTIVESEQVALW